MDFVGFLREYHGVEPQLTDRYGVWLGYKIQDVDKQKGRITTVLSIRDDHLSPSGSVHGGVISGFLDFSCGCTAFTVLEKGELCSTVELNVKYFRPLKAGDKIVAKAQVVHRGRTLCTVLAQVHKEGDPDASVALATGTFNIYRHRLTKERSKPTSS